MKICKAVIYSVYSLQFFGGDFVHLSNKYKYRVFQIKIRADTHIYMHTVCYYIRRYLQQLKYLTMGKEMLCQ